MKILIVGGTHRTGPYLVEELLDRGHEVILYHRGVHERHFSGPVTHIHGDRRDYSSFKQQMADVEVDAVVDMSLYYPEDSQAVVDAFQGRIKRSVHISSYDVYAIWAMWTHKTKRPSPIFPVPIPEDAPLRTELYPHKHQFQGKITKLDKLLCEHVIQAARKHSFPATVLRWPAIYGPGDPRTREWYIVKHILDGCAEIALPGRGLAMLHRGYFKNLAHSIALALENDDADGKIYNVGDEQVPTLWQLTQMIAEIMGSSIEIVPVPGDLLPSH